MVGHIGMQCGLTCYTHRGNTLQPWLLCYKMQYLSIYQLLTGMIFVNLDSRVSAGIPSLSSLKFNVASCPAIARGSSWYGSLPYGFISTVPKALSLELVECTSKILLCLPSLLSQQYVILHMRHLHTCGMSYF